MTRYIEGLGNMALELIRIEAAEYIALENSLEAILSRIQRAAQAEIGHYQPAVGPFPAWNELADSTKDQRVRLGFTENDPLYRTGELQNSIERERHGLEGVVGSTDEKMIYSEFGTSKEPPRPVLGPSAFKARPWIEKLAAAAVVAGFIGEDRIHQALGYDFQTHSSIPGER